MKLSAVQRAENQACAYQGLLGFFLMEIGVFEDGCHPTASFLAWLGLGLAFVRMREGWQHVKYLKTGTRADL